MASTGHSPAQPASPGLGHIKHVIVLMLENRSFDNLLGWLYHDTPPLRGQRFAGLTRDLWCPLDNIDAFGMPFVEKVPVRKNGEKPPHARGPVAGRPDFTLPAPDPGEGYHYTNHQLFQRYEVSTQFTPEPTNQGFVNDYRDALLYNTYSFGEPPTDPREIMTCYTPDQVPVLSELARQFAVCDQWFGSVPSQTLPNRHFTHAATSDGQVDNSHEPCRSPTIFNRIQDAIAGGRSDLSWRVYCGTAKDRSTGKVTLFSLTRLVMERLHDSTLDPNFEPIEEFYKAAAAGTLPTYAFLEPQIHAPGANDQHPPQDVRWGDRLIADVYRALASSPQWEQTLLVITYDEHGGCYDHVPPPGGAAPPVRGGAPGQFGFGFDRFGVRVPTVLVSPWIEPGTVCRAPGRTPVRPHVHHRDGTADRRPHRTADRTRQGRAGSRLRPDARRPPDRHAAGDPARGRQRARVTHARPAPRHRAVPREAHRGRAPGRTGDLGFRARGVRQVLREPHVSLNRRQRAPGVWPGPGGACDP
jgi:phospholipase C